MLSKVDKVFFNSVIIVITISIMGIMLHEGAHFLVAKRLGVEAMYHSDHVSLSKNINDFNKMIIAISGPLCSLIFGIITVAISYQVKKASIVRLFLLWFGLYNFASFLGYTLIASFVKIGDTGIIMQYFNVPTALRYLISIFSYLVLRYVLPIFAIQFINYGRSNKREDMSKDLFIYPLVISTTVILIISQPFDTWVSILPVVFVPFSFIGIIKKYRKVIHIEKPARDLIVDQYYAILVFLCIGAVITYVALK